MFHGKKHRPESVYGGALICMPCKGEVCKENYSKANVLRV